MTQTIKKHAFLRPILVLTVICLVTSVLLALTNAVTAPIIAATERAPAEAAKREVLPGADTFEVLQVAGLPETVTEADLEESIETVIAGYQKKNAVLSDHEKRVVSYHEIGHALVAALQTDSAPVQKITIIPRTSGALGYTMQVEQGEKNLMTRGELLAKLALTDEEREKSRQEMEKILGYVDKLNELDTEGVEPLISLFPVENVFREDKVVNGDMRDELVDLAPRKKDGQYLVPKTVE